MAKAEHRLMTDDTGQDIVNAIEGTAAQEHQHPRRLLTDNKGAQIVAAIRGFMASLQTLLAGKKDVQSAKAPPSTSGDADSFIDTISQNANGEITATKKRVNALWEESNRPASGSRTFGDRKLRTYLISSSMASADKPPDKGTASGNMLHFAWDWNGGFDSQLALLHDNTLWARSGTGLTGDAQSWNEWYGFFPGIMANNFYGMLTPAGSDSDFIRTTKSGIIPYQSGGVDGGHNSIGTSTWYFGNIFSTNYNGHHLHLHGTTSATMTAASTNPRITFSENEGNQPVHLVYTDWDSYRGPAGLKVVGGTSASPAWFEVEGDFYTANVVAQRQLIAGTTSTASEQTCSVRSVAGQIYMYAQSSATGIRGIYTYNAAGTAANVLAVNQSNVVTLYGSAASLRDSKNSTLITASYNDSGLSSASWIAAWNGYQLRAISPDNVANSMTNYKGAFSTIRTSNCGTTWCDGYYQKIGTLVTVCLGANNAVQLTTTSSVHIGTLPGGFKPSSRFFAAAATNVAGLGAQIHIDTDGKIYVTSKAGTIAAGKEFYFCAAFHAK